MANSGQVGTLLVSPSFCHFETIRQPQCNENGFVCWLSRKLTLKPLIGSAKSASQRATVRAMRVTRVMRATVQMLRIFVCFITFA